MSQVSQFGDYLDALGATPTADEARAITGDFDPADALAVVVERLVPAAAASGGGSAPYLLRVNGLVKDLAIPAGTTVLLLDPTAQEWQPNTEYVNGGAGISGDKITVGAYVLPTGGDGSVKFKAFENASAVSGTAEPEWSEDGSTTVDDGAETRPLLWTPNYLWGGAWQATHAFASGVAIIANGYVWASDGGGNSGGSEPDWPDTPEGYATVTDGAITWTESGPATVWAPSTRYSFLVNADPTTGYQQQFVIPTDAVSGTSYVFIGQPTGNWGTTSGTEPEWDAAVSGDGSVWVDGDILWSEDTSAEVLVLTGIEAPISEALITVSNVAVPGTSASLKLQDQLEVEADYGTEAISAEGNRFNYNDSNMEIGAGRANPVVYVDGEWRPTVAGA